MGVHLVGVSCAGVATPPLPASPTRRTFANGEPSPSSAPPRLISWEPAGRRVQQVPRQTLPPGIVGASVTRELIVPGEERVGPPVQKLSLVGIKCVT